MNTENKLPEDFKKRWITALRSGEYKQTFFRYNGPDGTMCVMEVGRRCAPGMSSYQRRDWLADILGPEQDKLVEMNDVYQMSFPELANYIEKNL